MDGSGWPVACRSWLQCSQRDSFPLYWEPAKCDSGLLCQQAGERHTGPYCSDSYWEGKKLIPVMGSSGPGCRKPLLTRVQSMAGQSQASQGTAQPRFYCICLNRIPRAGEFSPQHRKYPRHRRLHLILNCSFIFFTSV